MNPDDFHAWRVRMGYSRMRAARELGCGENQPAIWEAGKTPIPPYIALACAAIAWGLPPWRATLPPAG